MSTGLRRPLRASSPAGRALSRAPSPPVATAAAPLSRRRQRLWGPPLLCLSPSPVGTSSRRAPAPGRALSPLMAEKAPLSGGDEVDDSFVGLPDQEGWMLVAGFGSLLSEKSSRTTFPDLRNFRVGWIRNWRRVFAHTAAIFFQRGIARPDTGEISSLSCEPAEGAETAVALFEVQISNAEAVKAYIEREHEFRFVAAEAEEENGEPCRQLALICARFTDEEYKAKRCPPEEWQRRYVQHGVDRVWRDDVLPCRIYLRHCVLSAKTLSLVAYENFLDNTFLADRKTTIRQHLASNPGIMQELPPAELAERYSGGQ